jgi:calcium-dependent protein kinase
MCKTRYLLYRGSFSVVKLAANRKTGELRAIKIINKKKYWNSASLDQFEREIDILKKVQHKNVISIIDMYSTNAYLYIVLE